MFMDGINYLSRGGPTMWPLLLCAVVSVAVMIERYFVLGRASAGIDAFMARVKYLLEAGMDDEAEKYAVVREGPVARLATEAIQQRRLEPKLIEKRLEAMAFVETPKLTRRLNVLDTIITIAPLLGLLGTVTGMIGAFHIVGDPNATNGPAAITSNVAEALIATATGLAIAIVTLVGYNALGERVKTIVSSMELAATQIVGIFTERGVAQPQPAGLDHASSHYEAAQTRA